jgi:NAD(P)-dependent dehydrogenase (short-subunit alcohol dehydrogenase family)
VLSHAPSAYEGAELFSQGANVHRSKRLPRTSLPPAEPPRRRRSTLLDSQLDQRHTQESFVPGIPTASNEMSTRLALSIHGLEMPVHRLLVETAYSTAKAALDGLLASLKWETGAAGVLVNILSPGFTVTENNLANFSDDVRESVRGRTPSGRLSVPDDVAQAVLLLGSPANGYFTAHLPVAGGID